MSANIKQAESSAEKKIKKQRRIKYLVIFSISSLVIVMLLIIWKIQSDINRVYGPNRSSEQNKTTSGNMSDLVGQWHRTDGGYVIHIRAVDPSGFLETSYYNPRPINVSQSYVEDRSGMLSIFIELWDENYPGSTYELTFDPIQDVLYGSYYTPVAGQTFEVIFLRVEQE
jgi:hypothetical protein